jgi:heme-degrading monooxygenase HmoA
MIERHVTFNVYPDKKELFEKMFVEDYRPAMASMPGFVKVELLCQPEPPNQYQMVIRFESLEASTNWRSSGVHQSLQPRLKAMYSDLKTESFDVVI